MQYMNKIRIQEFHLLLHISTFSSRTFGHQWGRLTRKSITYQNVTTYKGRYQENNMGEVGRRGEGFHYIIFNIQINQQGKSWVSSVEWRMLKKHVTFFFLSKLGK